MSYFILKKGRKKNKVYNDNKEGQKDKRTKRQKFTKKGRKAEEISTKRGKDRKR